MLHSFSPIVVESPVDAMIRQIRDSISVGQLKSGDRLPSKRKLSEPLGVGRTQLRDAIPKLEFYGILKTRHQSGLYVSGLGIASIEGLINDM